MFVNVGLCFVQQKRNSFWTFLSIELLGVVEGRGILVEAARLDVELVSGACPRRPGLGPQEADNVVAKRLDLEVEHHLPRERLEATRVGADDHAAPVPDDAQLLQRTCDARQRLTQDSDGASDVAQAHPVLQQLARGP